MTTRTRRYLGRLAILLVLCATTAPPLWSQVPATVSGHVLDATDRPVVHGRVQLIDSMGAVVSTLTDASGRFSVRVPDGSYSLRVLAQGHQPYRRDGVGVRNGRAPELEVVLAQRPYSLPTVVVVGEALEGVPGATGIVSYAELESRRPLDIRDAVRTVAGIQVMDEDAFGLNLNIGIRGLDARRSSRVLLLEDGAPIHLGPYGDPTAHYHPPVEGLERVEVLKGSGQILHGPQTVGGVINFVRRAPTRERGGSVSLASGPDRFVGGHLRAGGGIGAHAVAVDYIRKQGDGVRAFQSHRVDDLVTRATLGIGAVQTLALKAGVYTERSRFGEAGLTQEEFAADPFDNAFRNDVFDLRRVAAQAIHRIAAPRNISLTTNAYVQDVERTSWRQANSSSDRFGIGPYEQRFACRPGAAGLDECGTQGRPREYRFWGVEPRVEAHYTAGAADGSLQLGVRLHSETARRRQLLGTSPAARTGELTRDNQLQTDALSAFIHNRVTLGSWSLSPGVRMEHVRSRNSNRMDGSEMIDRYTEVLPGLGGTFTGIAGTTLFAGLHRGFAPPRPADILSPSAGLGLVQVDAEISRTAEVGVRTRLVPFTSLEATWFRIDFDNQIVEGGLIGEGQRFVNAGRTLHQGLEIGAATELRDVISAAHAPYLSATLVYLRDARFRTDRLSTVDRATSILGNRVPFTPRQLLTGTLGVRHRNGLDLRMDLEHVAEQFSDDLNTVGPSPNGQRGTIPEYTVLHGTASRTLEQSRLTVFVGGSNLTDRVYITDRREGIMVGAPRRLRAGLRWNF